MLQSIHHLSGPLLDSLSPACPCLSWGAQNWTQAHQCWRDEKISLSLLSILGLMQHKGAISLLSSKGHTAHVQHSIHQSPKVLFHKAVFQPVGPHHVQVHRCFWALSEDRSDIFFPPVFRNFRLSQLFKCVQHNVHILICKVGQAASWTLFSDVPGCTFW